MKRDLRHLPSLTMRFRKGGRRAAALGLGLLALVTLVWQQEATMAVFVDREYAYANFTAGELPVLQPQLTPSYSTIAASWPTAGGSWATPQYRADWSANSTGVPASTFYTGTATSATLTTSGASQTSRAWLFTDVAAGATHACGITHGQVYCWGTSSPGGLGLGSTTTSNYPRLVGGLLAGKDVVQVSAGTDTTCARTSDGNAYCWGEGSSGQLGNGASADSSVPVAVSTISDVTNISVGTAHACAVADQAAYCWGAGGSYRLGNGSVVNRSAPTAVTTATGVLAGRAVSSVAAGDSHSCAVAGGLAFCWGSNTNGRVGNNAAIGTSATPVAVTTTGALMGGVVTKISAGYAHTCAVASGRAFCWGLNSYGQIGDSSVSSSSVAVAVPTSAMSATVTDISAGNTHSCAIAGGKVYCWGYGESGALGDGRSASGYSPVLSVGTNTGRTLSTVSAGTNFTCATGDTPASCWGAGLVGQIGNEDSRNVTIPTDVALSGAACAGASVRVGTGCSLLEGTDYFVQQRYTVGTWISKPSLWEKATTLVRQGLSLNLGSRTTTSITPSWANAPEMIDSYPEYTLERSTHPDGTNAVTVGVTGGNSLTDPGGVEPPDGYSKLSSGYAHSCAIVSGSLYCWGYNYYGQLGLGDQTDRTQPTLVSYFAGKTVTEVSAGQYHTCAIADGLAYCWGYNLYGQLGIGNTTTKYSPTVVSNQGGSAAVKIAAGQSHSCGLTADGNAWCWGLNNYGQLGKGNSTVGAINYTPQAVVAGAMGTGAATDITAGNQHSCAIANGRAYCWGRSNYGQVGVNGGTRTSPAAVPTNTMGTRTVTAISAGGGHTCAVAGGAAYCWGLNSSGQLGNNSTTSTYLPQAVNTQVMSGTVTDISGGTNSSCAVAGGATYCWGLGTSGQLGNANSSTNYIPVQAPPISSALASATAQATSVGYQHACSIIEGQLYCWGTGTNGRLGNGSTTSYNYPQATPLDPVCGGGSDRGDGTCTLAPGHTYYYRVSYTVDGALTRTGSWMGFTTADS